MKKNDNHEPLIFSADIVRPRRRLLASFADIFLFYIIVASIYMLAISPLTRLLPSFKNALNEQETKLEECRNMYLNGHLVYYDNSGSLMKNDVLIHKYLNDKINKGDLDENGDYIDPFYYFYLTYAHNNLKKDGELLTYTTDYLKNDIYQINNQSEPILWDKSYKGVAKLTDNAKEYINKYMNNDITAENKAYYDKIVDFYKNAVVEAEKVLLNSDQYQYSYSMVMKDNQIIYYHFTISSIITYIIFYFLYFLLIPALFKNGQTLAMRVLKISFVTREDKPISFSILLYRSLMQLLGYFFLPLFIPYMILGNVIFSLPLITIANFTINLWLTAFIGVILSIASFIVCLASAYKQNIYDKVVDIYALDLRNIHPVKDDNKEGDLWK